MSDMITLAFVSYGVGAVLSAVLFMRMANRGDGPLALVLAACWPMLLLLVLVNCFGGAWAKWRA